MWQGIRLPPPLSRTWTILADNPFFSYYFVLIFLFLVSINNFSNPKLDGYLNVLPQLASSFQPPLLLIRFVRFFDIKLFKKKQLVSLLPSTRTISFIFVCDTHLNARDGGRIYFRLCSLRKETSSDGVDMEQTARTTDTAYQSRIYAF